MPNPRGQRKLTSPTKKRELEMGNRRKVYVPSMPSRHDEVTGDRIPLLDLAAAEPYGDVTLLTPMAASIDVERDLEYVREGMVDFQSTDLIVAVGDLLLASAAIAYACDMHGSAQVLRWDKTIKQYDLVEIVL